MEMIHEVPPSDQAGTRAGRSGLVAIGRNGRGTGIVVAAGQVLTNAHNLRDTTTSVTFADGRVEQATAVGVDEEGDLAVLTVDTGSIAPLNGRESPCRRRRCRVRLRGRGTGNDGTRKRHGALVSGPARSPDPRQRRAHRPIGPGLVGRPGARPQRQVGGAQHSPHRFRLLSRCPPTPTCAPRRRAAAGRSPEHRRIGVAIVPSRVAARLVGPSAFPSVKVCSYGRSRTVRPRRTQASLPGIYSSRPGASSCARPTTSSACSTRPARTSWWSSCAASKSTASRWCSLPRRSRATMGGDEPASPDLPLRLYEPRPQVRLHETHVPRSCVPCIDAHNHLGRWLSRLDDERCRRARFR